MMKTAYLPKISILLQFRGEILSHFTVSVPNDKIRRICMESSGHNRANIWPPNCNKMLIFGK